MTTDSTKMTLAEISKSLRDDAAWWRKEKPGIIQARKLDIFADAIDAHLAPREVSDEDVERAMRASGDAIGGDYAGMRAALQADRQRGG